MKVFRYVLPFRIARFHFPAGNAHRQDFSDFSEVPVGAIQLFQHALQAGIGLGEFLGLPRVLAGESGELVVQRTQLKMKVEVLGDVRFAD